MWDDPVDEISPKDRVVEGEGGFCIVYKAWDKKLKKEVAVKQMKKDFLSMSSTKLLVNNELAMLFTLKADSHPNVCQFYRYIESKTDIILVMELCPSYKRWYEIQTSPEMETLARPLFRQLVEVLTYFHSFGTHDRDLKVENLLVDHRPEGL